MVGDVLEVAVALRRRVLHRLARHGGRARRHDDGRLGVAFGDAGVSTVLVVSAIAGERGQRARHLVEQGTGQGAVIDVVGGQRGGDDLAGVGVHAEVQLSPRPPRAGAVFLEQPLAWPAQLEPRAVHQQVHGLGIATSLGAGPPRLRHFHRYGPPAEGGVVRHTQGEAEQADDGADQAFGRKRCLSPTLRAN